MTLRATVLAAVAAGAAACAGAGCGSGSLADLPPAVTPEPSPPLREPPAGRVADLGRASGLPTPPPPTRATLAGGAVTVVLSPRGRDLEAIDARAGRRLGRVPVGIGPTHVASDGRGYAYVADTAGDAVLVVRTAPELQVVRRVHVPGSPHAMVHDGERGRLFVAATATNEVVELTGDARPRELARHPTVRQPETLALERPGGDVVVRSRRDGVVQRFDPDTSGR